MEAQFSAHSMAINEMGQQVADMNHAQRGTEAALTDVKREMAVAGTQAPAPPPPRAGWETAPGRTKVRTACKAEDAIAQINQTIKPLEDADVQATTSSSMPHLARKSQPNDSSAISGRPHEERIISWSNSEVQADGGM